MRSSHTHHQGHFARKRFGQHFLTDHSVIDAIISAIAPQPQDCLVEIGPGLGALTEPLISQLDKLHAVELDRDLAARLQQRFGERLMLHSADALAFDFGKLVEPAVPVSDNQQSAKIRVVGNLPYNISSPLLFHLINYAPAVLDQHFMLQKEVVDRMIATPGSKAYGRLSVMLQYHYAIDKLLDVPPESFTPPPKVESSVVRMFPYPIQSLPPVNLTHFSALVSAAFSQRRKMLRNTLADYQSRIDFAALNFDLTRRAEEVSVDEYVRLAQHLG